MAKIEVEHRQKQNNVMKEVLAELRAIKNQLV